MRRVHLVLLTASLSLAGAVFCAEQDIDLLALTTNFGPRRPATNAAPATVATPAPTPAPAPVAPPRTPPPAAVAPAPASPAPAATVAPAPAPISPSTQMLREESVRRQEAQVVAQQFIGEGYKLYYLAKYDEAIVKFEQGLKVLPRAQATELDYDRAVRGLSDCYGRMADVAFREGDKTKARDLARKALEFEPSNRAAENIIVKIKFSERETAEKTARAAADANKPKRPVAQPELPELSETPEFRAKQDQIKKLFREGRILFNSGQYDEAEKRYKQVLLIDHYNEDAYKNLQDLNQQRTFTSYEGIDAVRRQRLWQVDEAWIPTVGGEVKMPEKATTPVVTVNAADKEKIERKLRTIKFPEVSFRDAAISDVVKFLSEESVKFDPDQPKEGVSIVLGPGVSTAGAAPVAAPAPVGAPDAAAILPAAAPAPVGGGIASKPITLTLRNVPMEQVLKYVTQLGGLRYRIDSSAVILLPEGADVGEMVTRSFNVSPDAIKALLAGGGGAAGMGPAGFAGAVGGAPAAGGLPVGGAAVAAAPAAGGGGSEELKTFFINSGVPFPPGSSISYFERARTIYVRNTIDNIEIFEKVLSTFNVVPSQVEIEAKFIEITQSDLDELGFQWALGTVKLGSGNNGGLYTMEGGGRSSDGTTAAGNWLTQGLRGGNFGGNTVDKLLFGNTASGFADAVANFQGILTDPNVSLVINALSQKKSADVLSAPKVTTISGAQAQIRVVQEFIYPSEFSQPTVANGSAPTPSIPTAFKTREIGVILNVTPTVGADGYTINLTMVPEVSSFLGMLDYSPGTVVAVDTNNSAISVPYKIWQPLFETRNLTTSVVIWDGQTVVLGGLIREEISKIDDKVPFLGDIPFVGRLFRSKSTSRNKRNLLVFVTARLIDPAGNLIHRPETPGFRFDPSGNPIRGPEPSLLK